MCRVLVNIPRKIVYNALLIALSNNGKTIADITRHKRKIYGDPSQLMYADKPVWHTRTELIESIAIKLHLSQNLWGPNRSSSDFYNIVDQEITKLKRHNQLVSWRTSPPSGILRLTSSIDISKLEINFDDIQSSYTQYSDVLSDDTTEANLKRMFVSVLAHGSKANTYKFALARAILDHCRDPTNSHTISYKYLADKFLRYYWYQECNFHIKQDYKISSNPHVINIIRDIFGDNAPGSYDLLTKDDLNRAKQQILSKVFGHARSKTSLVVPKFQKIKTGRYSAENKIFYDYDDDAKVIKLNPSAFEFFHKNYSVLSRVVLLEWAKFLEKINGSLPRLIAKIASENNMRGDLTKYRRMYRGYTSHCFYCCTRLEDGYTQVDHFIPWSYIFDDDPWNLVLACNECNGKKSNSLAQHEFKESLIRRNQTYSTKIRPLLISLDQLDRGRGWEREIDNHYTNCQEYGFGVVSLP